MNKRQKGKEGEELALNYLKKMGYKIIETNFSCRLGEIDIVAKDGKTYCFIEVKLRKSKEFGSPLEAVDHRKTSKLIQTAKYYCLINNLSDVPLRFDVVGIVKSNQTEIVLIKNAISQ
ncbi:MAG: YraN family protein [bacterium]